MPCGHGGYCGGCARTLLKQWQSNRHCPICRAELTAVAKVDLNTRVGAAGKVLEGSVAQGRATRGSTGAETAAASNMLPGSLEMEEFVARLRSARRRIERRQGARSGAEASAAVRLDRDPDPPETIRGPGASVLLSDAMAASRTVYL